MITELISIGVYVNTFNFIMFTVFMFWLYECIGEDLDLYTHTTKLNEILFYWYILINAYI